MPGQPTVESLSATITELREEINEMRGIKPRATTAQRHGVEGQEEWTITPEMRADPKFMLDTKNREKIKAAAQNHRFV